MHCFVYSWKSIRSPCHPPVGEINRSCSNKRPCSDRIRPLEIKGHGNTVCYMYDSANRNMMSLSWSLPQRRIHSILEEAASLNSLLHLIQYYNVFSLLLNLSWWKFIDLPANLLCFRCLQACALHLRWQVTKHGWIVLELYWLYEKSSGFQK